MILPPVKYTVSPRVVVPAGYYNKLRLCNFQQLYSYDCRCVTKTRLAGLRAD